MVCVIGDRGGMPTAPAFSQNIGNAPAIMVHYRLLGSLLEQECVVMIFRRGRQACETSGLPNRRSEPNSALRLDGAGECLLHRIGQHCHVAPFSSHPRLGLAIEM